MGAKEKSIHGLSSRECLVYRFSLSLEMTGRVDELPSRHSLQRVNKHW